MAQSDPEGKEKTGNVDYKFEYGYTVAVIECHPAKFWVSSRRKGLVKNPNYSVNNETRDQQCEVAMSPGLLHIYIYIFENCICAKGSALSRNCLKMTACGFERPKRIAARCTGVKKSDKAEVESEAYCVLKHHTTVQ